MAWPVAADIINQVALECGLLATAVADPWGSTNVNVVQLRTMLTPVGTALLKAFPWSHLQLEQTFSTVDGTANYAMPAEFGRYRDGTGWNRSQTRPLAGPLTDAQWQRLKGGAVTGLVTQAFRIWLGELYLYPTPTAVETVAYEYTNRYWASGEGDSEPTKVAPTAATDIVYFDAHLLQRALKLRFLQDKGFPSQAAQDEFTEAWNAVTGGDGAAPVLGIGGGSGTFLLSEANLPETGYGV